VPASRSTPRPGRCRQEIAVGITECELVRLKNTRPTDVLIGDNGRGQREVQVLYSEPGGSRNLHVHRQSPEPDRQAGPGLIMRRDTRP
jgi:hypothetical protein